MSCSSYGIFPLRNISRTSSISFWLSRYTFSMNGFLCWPPNISYICMTFSLSWVLSFTPEVPMFYLSEFYYIWFFIAMTFFTWTLYPFYIESIIIIKKSLSLYSMNRSSKRLMPCLNWTPLLNICLMKFTE